ncbi:hypothetical protein BDN71DRAFT_188425 [Pleurotus eryngii]|uniref:Uncharacterized protein n=1 Tax=Pleurotus eryngii TaxID=5323 RepID=A0A9P5ZNU9_PLEER|nr:hypothetical protein BDN71DRAFT_188425 [Pleurotus eryngii]
MPFAVPFTFPWLLYLRSRGVAVRLLSSASNLLRYPSPSFVYVSVFRFRVSAFRFRFRVSFSWSRTAFLISSRRPHLRLHLRPPSSPRSHTHLFPRLADPPRLSPIASVHRLSPAGTRLGRTTVHGSSEVVYASGGDAVLVGGSGGGRWWLALVGVWGCDRVRIRLSDLFSILLLLYRRHL